MSITWTLVCDYSLARLYNEGPDGALQLLGTRENPLTRGDPFDAISVSH